MHSTKLNVCRENRSGSGIPHGKGLELCGGGSNIQFSQISQKKLHEIETIGGGGGGGKGFANGKVAKWKRGFGSLHKLN